MNPAEHAHHYPTLNERTGQTIAQGRYTLRRLIGQGGMGVVYEAIQHPGERRVAIKLIPALDDLVIQRFEREANTVSMLQHPNTITLFEHGRTGSGELFLVMEYLEGRSLKEIIAAEAPLGLMRQMHILSQITHALTEAHDLGIVHRDIKPDNIFVMTLNQDPDFVKVLDFGIAKAIVGELATDLTTDGRIVGTPKYMAPEQIMSQPADRRADIYSLGCVLYEMACGQAPFIGSSAMLMVEHTRHERPLLNDREQLGLSHAKVVELERIIHRAMAIEPEQRYTSMKTFREDLVALATDTPIRRVTSSYAAINPATLPPAAVSSSSSSAETSAQSMDDAPTIARQRPDWSPPPNWPPANNTAADPEALPLEEPSLLLEGSSLSQEAEPPGRLWHYWALLVLAVLALLVALINVLGSNKPSPSTANPAQPIINPAELTARADKRVVEQATRALEVGYADKSITLCTPLLERQSQVEPCEAIVAQAYGQKQEPTKGCPYLKRALSRAPADEALVALAKRFECP